LGGQIGDGERACARSGWSAFVKEGTAALPLVNRRCRCRRGCGGGGGAGWGFARIIVKA